MLDNLQLLFVWAPIINVQVILEGIFVGAVFALSAYGLALVWGVMNIKNLAQGDFVIMGGYLALALSSANVPLPLILILVIVFMFVYGYSQYLWPLIMTTSEKYWTVVMGMKIIFTESYEGVALPRTAERFAYIILSMLPPVLVVVILQKWFIKGLIQTEK